MYTENIFSLTANNPTLQILGFGILLFSLILELIYVISCWKILVKDNKPGWSTLIPIYNVVVLLQLAEMPLINLVLLCIPVLGIFIYFKMNINIAKKFGKTTGFGIGISLLPIIFLPILAFSDTGIKGKEEETSSNNFDAMNVINNSTDTNNITEQNETINTIPIEENNIETNNIESIPTEMNSNVNNDIPVFETTDNEAVNNSSIEINNDVAIDNSESINPIETNILDNMNIEPEVKEEVVSPVQNIIEPNNDIPVFDTQINNDISNDTIENNNQTETNILDNVSVEPEVIEEIVSPIQNTVKTVNAFNAKPETVEIQNETNIEPPIAEQTTDESKKTCKACGNQMPSIVSICPICGTENE